jgi:hypothetical protein
MVTAKYSTVIDHNVDVVWAMIRDFNNYPAYIDGVTESIIEDGKSGDEVGATRRFLYGGTWIRQRLSAHSDHERSLTYAGVEPFAFPAGLVSDTPPPALYEGTMHVRGTDGNETALEWTVTVDAAPEHAGSWRNLLSGLIEMWATSLKGALSRVRGE